MHEVFFLSNRNMAGSSAKIVYRLKREMGGGNL